MPVVDLPIPKAVIAQRWILSLSLHNQTAKHLLHFFLAFYDLVSYRGCSLQYLSNQMETSKIAIERAISLLLKNNLITKEANEDYDNTYRYRLNIPEEREQCEPYLNHEKGI